MRWTRLRRLQATPGPLHLCQNGGHGLGVGNPNRTINRWFEAFIHWLDVTGADD